MRRFVHYNSTSGGYYPVDLYNLLVYNNFGHVGSESSTRNIQLRRTSDSTLQDFLFDGTQTAKDDITNWLGGADGRLQRLYNEGVGGSNYDLIQSTAGSQPYLDTTNWLIDFSAGNYWLDSAKNTPITDKNSLFMASFKSQSGVSEGVVLNEIRVTTRRNVIFSDTTSNNKLYNYSPATGGDNLLTFGSQQPTDTNRVYAVRRVGNDVTSCAEKIQIDTLNDSKSFSSNTSLTLGRQSGQVYFSGEYKGLIVHDSELTIPILEELSDNLEI